MMDSIALSCVVIYTCVSTVLLFKIWRRDIFFAVFMSMIVLYSIVSQWGYLMYPELSEVVLKMYFGVAPLAMASIFSTLSLVALYIGYKRIYRPWVRQTSIHLHSARRFPVLYFVACSMNAALLAVGYFYYRGELSYGNASDEAFLSAAGKSYMLFVQIYKSSIFSMLVMYAVAREKLLDAFDRAVSWALLFIIFSFFVLTTIGVGSRTDPLALVLGLIGFEYYMSSKRVRHQSPHRLNGRARSRLGVMKWIGISGTLVGTVILLTLLELSRSESASFNDALDTPHLVQAFLLKDYYPPFHVLIGAMEKNYIDPFAVLVSNSANSLMFLGVDFLQAYVVNQWEPGLVTRTASPAFFAFTEGYVAMGWAGFLYNGIVWAAGIALWRLLSRTNDQGFNSVAFAVTVALAATVPRSQSAYFIKDIYLWFIPALALYCLAAGRSPFKLSRRSRLGSLS